MDDGVAGGATGLGAGDPAGGAVVLTEGLGAVARMARTCCWMVPSGVTAALVEAEEDSIELPS